MWFAKCSLQCALCVQCTLCCALSRVQRRWCVNPHSAVPEHHVLDLLDNHNVLMFASLFGGRGVMKSAPILVERGVPLVGPISGSDATRIPFLEQIINVRASYMDEMIGQVPVHAQRGARHKGGNRAVTSPPHVRQHHRAETRNSRTGGRGPWAGERVGKNMGRRRTREGTEDTGATPGGTGGTATDRKGACEWEAATTQRTAWPASPVAAGCQGNPCSMGIRWGVSRAAQTGCLHNTGWSLPGPDQP